MGNYAAARDLDSDSGVETPVPALFIGRGCSSTPSLTPWTRRSHARPFGNPFWRPVFRINLRRKAFRISYF